jgi:hypothetical protein
LAKLPTKQKVASFFQANMDFARFARLTKALGSQANDAQLRFLKAMIFEQSVEEYSAGMIKYVGEEGCDLIIPSLDARVEMKYVENALYTASRKELREQTGGIKLMNSMGTNTHKVLPSGYADFLIFIGNQGAMLFDRATLESHIVSGGDGITANIPTEKGIVLATPAEMTAGSQTEVDFIQGLKNYIKTYIQGIK